MKAIRRLKQEDLGTIRTIFFDTVNKINKTDYDEVQRKAWTDASDDLQLWTNSFRDKIAYVVEKIVRLSVLSMARLKDTLIVFTFIMTIKVKGLQRCSFRNLSKI